MALSYSVRFKKYNFANKLLVEKEGEVLLDRKFLKLKGKGANDAGENLNLTEIKEVKIEKDTFLFNTFAKEKFILSGFAGNLEAFLADFYQIRNEFFVDNLFMKQGMLMAEYDCFVEITPAFNKVSVSKGKCLVQFYEQSIVIIPKLADALVIYLNFIKQHQFDDDNYVLQIDTDSGNKVSISKFGSNFEDAQQIMEKNLEKLYQRVLNAMNQTIPGFNIAVLLKLAYAMKCGKAVAYNSLKKVDAALPLAVMDTVFANNEVLKQKIQFLRSLDKDEQFYLGLSFDSENDGRDIITKSWYLCALPNLNVIVMGIGNNPKDHRVFFFRIVMEHGMAADKVEGKVLEINQCMVLFNYDLSPLYKDKNELRKTKYKVAIMKLAFLRLFRKSLLGISQAGDLDRFKSEADKLFTQAKVLHSPQLRHKQIFKPTLK